MSEKMNYLKRIIIDDIIPDIITLVWSDGNKEVMTLESEGVESRIHENKLRHLSPTNAASVQFELERYNVAQISKRKDFAPSPNICPRYSN